MDSTHSSSAPSILYWYVYAEWRLRDSIRHRNRPSRKKGATTGPQILQTQAQPQQTIQPHPQIELQALPFLQSHQLSQDPLQAECIDQLSLPKLKPLQTLPPLNQTVQPLYELTPLHELLTLAQVQYHTDSQSQLQPSLSPVCTETKQCQATSCNIIVPRADRPKTVVQTTENAPEPPSAKRRKTS